MAEFRFRISERFGGWFHISAATSNQMEVYNIESQQSWSSYQPIGVLEEKIQEELDNCEETGLLRPVLIRENQVSDTCQVFTNTLYSGSLRGHPQETL